MQVGTVVINRKHLYFGHYRIHDRVLLVFITGQIAGSKQQMASEGDRIMVSQHDKWTNSHCNRVGRSPIQWPRNYYSGLLVVAAPTCARNFRWRKGVLRAFLVQ